MDATAQVRFYSTNAANHIGFALEALEELAVMFSPIDGEE